MKKPVTMKLVAPFRVRSVLVIFLEVEFIRDPIFPRESFGYSHLANNKNIIRRHAELLLSKV